MRISGVVLAVALALAGCKKAPPAEVPIKGQVKGANGQPLAGVVVRLHIENEKGVVRTVSCPTGPGGTFEGRGVPGTYKVTVLALPKGLGSESPEPKAPGPPPGVPASYASIRDTPWEVEVPAGGKDDIRLEVR